MFILLEGKGFKVYDQKDYADVPPTAYNLKNPNSRSGGYQDLWSVVDRMNKGTDSVILCYGETDCRRHILVQPPELSKNKPISARIDDTITAYAVTLQELVDEGVHFIVCGIPPPNCIHDERIMKYLWEGVPPEVFVPTYKEFNDKLRDYCKSKNYPYLDVYSKSVDKDGCMNQELSAGNHHLDPRKIPDLMLGLVKEAEGK